MELTELEQATVKNMREAVEKWISLASHDEKLEAVLWYAKAHAVAVELSTQYGITVDQASAVLSVLSPGNDWTSNQRDAFSVCRAWKAGTYDATVTAYGKQVGKAYRILNDCKELHGDELNEYVGTKNARKTIAFYHNILNPKESQAVTIDRWILRALGLPVNRTNEQLYKLGTLAITQIAAEHRCQPHKVQALVWVCIRNRGGLPQTAFDLPGF